MTEINSGDTLRITHVATGAHLHSHPVNYGHPHSSGQQQVTAYAGKDYNDLWIVQPSGAGPVKDGDQIRLAHASTGRWLHSHRDIPAPITTSQQEVTGWGGGDQQTDPNDLWRVEVEGGGVWTTDKQVRLIHVATNAALHSHDIKGPGFPSNQQEVTAYAHRDHNDFWTAATTTEVAPHVQPLPPSPPSSGSHPSTDPGSGHGGQRGPDHLGGPKPGGNGPKTGEGGPENPGGIDTKGKPNDPPRK